MLCLGIYIGRKNRYIRSLYNTLNMKKILKKKVCVLTYWNPILVESADPLSAHALSIISNTYTLSIILSIIYIPFLLYQATRYFIRATKMGISAVVKISMTAFKSPQTIKTIVVCAILANIIIVNEATTNLKVENALSGIMGSGHIPRKRRNARQGPTATS